MSLDLAFNIAPSLLSALGGLWLKSVSEELRRLQVKGARAAATAGAVTGGLVPPGCPHTGATGGVMAHSRATREGLRRAYVFGNLSLERAAIQCGVSVYSARHWKKRR